LQEEQIMSDVKLYGFPRSNYVRTARLVLEEKGVAYDLVPMDIGSEELIAVHPFGKIPAFAHGDFEIYETSAICRYVDEAFDGPSLQPADTKRRAWMEQWISSLNRNYDTDLIRHVVIERLVVPMRGGETNEARIAEAMPRITREMEVLESWLAGHAYLAGDTVSIADFLLVPMLAIFRTMPEGETTLAGRTEIARWWEAMAARPSFAATAPPPREG
jgi:glutathione S-transferase